MSCHPNLKFVLLLWLSTFSTLSLAQDNNYWTQQYGNVSTILGGAVTGSYVDNGSIYYNPATLAFTDTIKVSFSAGLYQTNVMRISNPTRNDTAISDWNFVRFPVSFYPVIRLNSKSRLGFIYLLRIYSQFEIHDFKDEPMDVTGNGTMQPFIGAYDYTNRLSENWYGLSYSRTINPKSSFGVSVYGIYRNQSVFYNYSANAIMNASKQEYLTTDITHYLDYDLYQGIIKAGYFHENNQYSYGIALTLPSFYVLSYSRSSSQFYFSGWQTYTPGDSINNLLVVQEQLNQRANFKYPATLSLGIKWKLPNFTLYATSDLYAPIKEYTILSLSDSGNVTLPSQFEKATNLALNSETALRFFGNIAVGAQFKIRNNKSIISGISTDFNGLPKGFNPYGFNMSTARNNLFHASAGMDVQIKKVKINGGIKVSYGYSRNQQQFVNMSTASTQNLLIGNRSYDSNYNYFAFNLLLGLNF